MKVSLEFYYTAAQQRIFFETGHRFKTVHKGRRFGLTHGASLFLIDQMLDPGNLRVLWGDTVATNIERYIERYWKPALKGLPKNLWTFKSQRKEIHIHNSVCDFRSADRPENWEGFGYDLIFLNEAGIILQNRYLWENAVRPMLLDNPQSKALIGGTPKGKIARGDMALFYELCQNGKDDTKPDWANYHFSSFDNPLLKMEDIEDLLKEVPENIREQEIHGKFIDVSDVQYIESEIIDKAVARKYHPSDYEHGVKTLTIDFARKHDRNVISKKQGCIMFPVIVHYPKEPEWTQRFAAIAANIIEEFKPDGVFVDEGESGGGLIDILRQWGYKVIPVMFGAAAGNPNRYLNKRAEMAAGLRNWLDTIGSIPNDSETIADIAAISYTYVKERVLKLNPKSELERSSDIFDGMIMHFAYPIRKKDAYLDRIRARHHKPYDPFELTSWVEE
jgi:hypothetical protein